MIYPISYKSDLFPQYGVKLQEAGIQLYQVVKGSKGLWVAAKAGTFAVGDPFRNSKALLADTSLGTFRKKLTILLDKELLNAN